LNSELIFVLYVFRCVLKLDSSETEVSEMISKPWADLGKSVNTARIYRWLYITCFCY